MRHEKRTPEQEAALKEHIARTDELFARFKAKELSYYDYTAACNASFRQMKNGNNVEPAPAALDVSNGNTDRAASA